MLIYRARLLFTLKAIVMEMVITVVTIATGEALKPWHIRLRD